MAGKSTSITQGFRTWRLRAQRLAANLLFPPQCAFCEADLAEAASAELADLAICHSCREQLQPPTVPACPACGMPLSGTLAADGQCVECRGHHFNFSAVRTLGVYENHLRQAVLQTKHAAHEPLGSLLGESLAQLLKQQPFSAEIEMVLPIPMHWWKRFRRERRPPTGGGEGLLLPDERRKNVRDAYALSSAFDVTNSTLLLIDDVITTGATASDAARALLAAGAKQVFVAAVARGTGHRKG